MVTITELISQIEAAREKATPGNWDSDNDGDVWTDAEKAFCPGLDQEIFRVFGTTKRGPDRGDAAYIALCNPENIGRLIKTLKKYREALEFYANEDSWSQDGVNLYSFIENNEGETARKALEE